MSRKQFGGKITALRKARYKQSPNWRDGSFKNLIDTQTGIDWRQLPGILYKQIKGHEDGYPKQALPVSNFNLEEFLRSSSTSKFVWFGHSVLLMRVNDQTILIDPMFGDDASPIAPTKTRRFSDNTFSLIDELPDIDLMLITHDHYDHLDYASISRLKSKVRTAFVAMGVKRHLVSWGYDDQHIQEFDWWDTQEFADIRITFTPTRHFSGRGLTSLAKCLWGGWAFKTSSENIWFSGDGGFGDHFKEIGNRLGPFDIGFMECGQYCVDWPQIHMFPEESVQAAIHAGVKAALPVHWAGFNLSYQHSWYEPAESFVQNAGQHGLAVLTPSLGEVFQVDSSTSKWWQKHI